MPSYDYDSGGYGRTLAQLMQQRGDREAAMHLQRGDIEAQGWANAGGTIANAIAGWQQNVRQNRQLEMEAARESRRAEAEGLQMESARMDLATKKRGEKGAATARAVLPLARRENGVVGYDRDLIQREMETAGHADMVPDIFARLDEQEAGHFKVIEARREAIAGDAWRVLQGGDTSPETFGAMLDLWGENDLAPKRELDALRKAAEKEGPERALLAAVESSPRYAEMLQKARTANQPDLATVAPGSSVYDKRNPAAGPLFTAPQEPKTPTNIEQAILQATDPAERQRLIAMKEQFARAGRAPAQPPTPSFATKDVLNDAGERVVANYDSRTGKMVGPDGQVIQNPRPIPSAMETQDSRKFQQAGPILSAVSELSEQINTQQGLIAKMAGGAKKVASQANYDDDVAEYEALISGFTPLVARALGHTGVLTQQDVDSVKALFPKPGDSKTLRDRKINRINSIIGELESDARPPQTTGGGDGLVDMVAPDGGALCVPRSDVERLKGLGAKVK